MPKLKRERAVVSCFFAFFFHSPLVSLHKGALQIWHPSGFYPIYKSGARPVPAFNRRDLLRCCVYCKQFSRHFSCLSTACLRRSPPKNAGNHSISASPKQNIYGHQQHHQMAVAFMGSRESGEQKKCATGTFSKAIQNLEIQQ